MKIDLIRDDPKPPPVKAVRLTLSPHEADQLLKMLDGLAVFPSRDFYGSRNLQMQGSTSFLDAEIWSQNEVRKNLVTLLKEAEV